MATSTRTRGHSVADQANLKESQPQIWFFLLGLCLWLLHLLFFHAFWDELKFPAGVSPSNQMGASPLCPLLLLWHSCVALLSPPPIASLLCCPFVPSSFVSLLCRPFVPSSYCVTLVSPRGRFRVSECDLAWACPGGDPHGDVHEAWVCSPSGDDSSPSSIVPYVIFQPC